MARGWESKSVEEQQAESASERTPKPPAQTPEQKVRQNKRKELLLIQVHICDQLRRAHNPNHRKVLECALADLEAKLAVMD